MDQPFSDDVVRAVCRHMNDDHAADSLLICQTLGGQPAAAAATMTGVDGHGVTFDVSVDGRPEQVRIPFNGPVTERTQIRLEVVRMYREARAAADQ